MNRILFCGDLIVGDQPVLFGFGLDSIWSKRGYCSIFEEVKEKFEEADYVVGNLECVVKERNVSDGVSEWSMCCDRNLINALVTNHINVVSVANNHTMDYGIECFDAMVKLLVESGTKVIGLREKPYEILDVEGKKIALIGASYVGKYNKEKTGFFYSPTKEEWKNLVKDLADCDYKIAYVHWGNAFISLPTQDQLDQAKEITESGIDCIIGHHPHILQPSYLVNDKPVVFSLGNFVSDYWQERLRKTNYVELQYQPEKPKFYTNACMINKEGAPTLLSNVTEMVCATDLKTSDKKVVFKNRKIMRREYLIRVISNFWRYKKKSKFIKWAWDRAVYIVKYQRQEKENPNILY
ncbi:MAG: CapA family protein, partial [Clostridia bacterium]|nr:CapA family protein [Clostridia bacterium]